MNVKYVVSINYTLWKIIIKKMFIWYIQIDSYIVYYYGLILTYKWSLTSFNLFYLLYFSFLQLPIKGGSHDSGLIWP